MRWIFFAVIISCLAGTVNAQQSGPGSIPSPWNYGSGGSGVPIFYNNGGITLNNPTGGNLGPGWVNAAGGYALNGVPLPGAIGSQPGNLVYATPNGAPGMPGLRPLASGDLPSSLAIPGTLSVISQTTLGPLTVNGLLGGAGVAAYLNSPPCIGCSTPNTAKFITAPISDRSTNVATTAYVMSQLSFVNVLDYGADPSGATDSCATAVPNALSAIPSTGGTLYWPHGTYLCSTQPAVSNKPIAISGDGPGISVINFSSGTTASAGFSISQNNAAFPTSISGLSIVTNVAQAVNAGILINYTIPPNVDRTITISDVDINGGIANANYWHFGLRCLNCGYGVIDNFHIKGKNESNPPGGISASNMQAGITLKAKSSDMRITKGSVIFSYYGVYTAGDSESQQFDDTTMLAINYGWYNDDFADSADATAIPNAPGPRIYNSHCSAYFGCVFTQGWTQTIVIGNLFYRRQEGTVPFVAVDFLNGTYQGPVTVGSTSNTVTGNTSFGASAGSPVATFVSFDTLSSNSQVTNNIAQAYTYFADFGNGTQFNIVSNNNAPSALSGAWFNRPSQNTIAINDLPINAGGSDTGTATLTANSATPNIGGGVVTSFLTANTGATIITNFLNGYIGEIITIVANDANTTIQNNAGMILHSGVNYTMSLGNTLTLKREQNTYWREIGRS